MDTLFISPFYAPELISTAKWNATVVNILRRHSNVKVWTSHPFYPEWKVKCQGESADGSDVSRGGRWVVFPENSYLRRLVLEISFLFFVLRQCLFNRLHYDRVVVVIPPSLFVLMVVALFKRSHLVTVVHDLQSVHLLANNKMSVVRRMAAYFIEKIEGYIFSKSDDVVLLSHEMRDAVVRLYGGDLRAKCSMCYPFPTVAQYDHKSSDLERELPSEKVNIVYSGALGEKQNPLGLIEVIKQLSVQLDHSKYKVSIFSNGAGFRQMKSALRHCPIVEFFSLVEDDVLPELMWRSDIHLVPQAAGTSQGSLPSKLANILQYKKAMVLYTDKNSELESLFVDDEMTLVINDWSKSYHQSGWGRFLENQNNFSGDAKRREQIARLFCNLPAFSNSSETHVEAEGVWVK